MGLDSCSTGHGGCSVVFARVSSNILSETVPLMNSDESRRMYTNAECLRTLA